MYMYTFVPHPDVKSMTVLNLKLNLFQTNTKQCKTMQHNWTVNLQNSMQRKSRRNDMLPGYSCWCDLVDARVYRYLDLQNDQHEIKYEIVRQVQSN